MSHRIRWSRLGTRIALALLTAAPAAPVAGQVVDASQFGALRWRLIGPFRAGRVSAGAVDPSDPDTYYFGTPGGGVWKSTNAGQTWTPIFDRTGMASIGALAISSSNPQIIYAGTGEETRGDGVYKSTDGGKSWINIGLRDTHYIGSIVISATNPDELVVGAIGDRTPSQDRGVFRTTDGGRTWTKVLFVDDTAGCPSVVAAPDAPRVMFATLYPAIGLRGASLAAPILPGQPTAAPGAPPFKREPALFKSIDGGATWTKLAAKGLASPPVGRQALAVAAKSGGRIVLAGLHDGLYRSEDGGETWARANHDPRITPVGVIADPSNPDLVYVTQTALYRSIDGGRTFDAFAGAPSGDDFQFVWVDPRNSRRLLAGVDQGAVVSVDGGASWSSWYNQPTGQFYHVITDDRFPYHVYAAQQDSGSVAVPNRSDFGEISYRDWYSPGGFEFGYLAPDPLDPDIVFAGGWYRTVVRFDRRTGQIAHVFVPGTKYRSVNNAPMFFSPHDPHTLYYGTQFLMKTTDGGLTWQEISPDLTDVPGHSQAPPRPPTASVRSITTLSVSTVKAGVIWTATNNGVIQMTADAGATWKNVSPPGLPPNAAFEIIDAGRHDAATAYATLIVPQDVRPYIYRTQDGGATWQRIVNGLPDTAFARVVREDPVRKGLLFCGTESAVYVSFDAGDHWQSLQLNLPSSSMRDLWIHGEDLVLGTYGRSLWVLDNITPLRQLGTGAPAADLRMLEPAPAIRARWDVNGDTPLPIEVPTAPNPPEGAIIDYSLAAIPDGEMTMTITDARGGVVRTFTSSAPPAPTLLANVPEYWFAAPSVLTKNRGLNRFVWNLRYPNPKILPFGYFGGLLDFVEYTLADHAIPGRTPRDQPEGPLALPGEYTVVLSAGGRSDRKTLIVKPDPRVRTSEGELRSQFELATRVTDALAVTYDSFLSLKELRALIAAREKALSERQTARSGSQVRRGRVADRVSDAVQALDKKLDAVQNGTTAAPGVGIVNRDLARYFEMLVSGDARPAERLRASVAESCQALTSSLALWRTLNATDLPGLNRRLISAKQMPFTPVVVPATPSCMP
jgi:photosystem II stability/assembly factor-like uncharacterized protein